MDQLFDIQGLHVAITGASSGFGHHFAGLLAQRGARLTLGARRLDRLRERVESIENDGGSAIATALSPSLPCSAERQRPLGGRATK